MSDRFHVSGHWVLYSIAIFNGPHLFSTWTRVYMPARERFRRPLHYWVIPGLLGAFAVGCLAADGLGPVYLRTVIFYYAFWHFTAQAGGILRIYQRKHGVVDTFIAPLEKTVLFMACFFMGAHRIYTGPWDLFGVQLFHPYPKAWMVNAFGAVTLAVALFYVAVLVRTRQVWTRPALIAMTVFGFYMPFVVIKDGTSAFAAAALWHAVQYIGIVWHYNRTRYEGKRDPAAKVISWASQPGRTLQYCLVLGLCAAGSYAVIGALALAFHWDFTKTALGMWTSMTLGHYYLDGVIWKFKQYDLQNLVTAPVQAL